jgi:hypothetical protein
MYKIVLIHFFNIFNSLASDDMLALNHELEKMNGRKEW